MATKKIQAKNMREALALIKQTFGSDAVILSNREIPTGVEFIVTDEFHEPTKLESGKNKGYQSAKDDNIIIDLQTPGESAIHALKFELLALKNLLQEQLGELAWENKKRINPVQAMITRRLINLGFTPLVAGKIASGLEKDLVSADEVWNCVSNKIINSIPIGNVSAEGKNLIYGFFGCAGVGKTTVVAKLAAQQALKYGAQSVAIISCDNEKIGAGEALKIYANILNIPIRIIENLEQMRDALNDFKKKQLVLIDTPAISPNNTGLLKTIGKKFPAEYFVHKLQVMPANMQNLDLERSIEFFQGVNIVGSVITKMDEAISAGAVLSATISHQLPIHYISDGQKVPDDIHVFSPSQFVRAVLNLIMLTKVDDIDVARSMAEIKVN